MIRRARPLLAFLILALAAVAPATTAQGQDAPPPWQAREQLSHPLVGLIWNVAERRFVTPDELADAVGRARLMVLGETHDNPDHHRIQAWAVARFVAPGAPAGIALEMITADRQKAVDAHFEAHPGDAAGLGAALDWERSGWPDWRHYAAAIAPAVAARGPVIAANLPMATLRQVAKQGIIALGARRLKETGLDQPIDGGIYDALSDEMVAAHCGQIKPDQARPFATLQIARDAMLADGLLVAARRAKGRAIVIAGTGHARRDRGVPMHLGRRMQLAGVLVLAPLEVRAGLNAAEEYAAAFDRGQMPFDYVWFTPGQRRDDPCLSMPKKS